MGKFWNLLFDTIVAVIVPIFLLKNGTSAVDSRMIGQGACTEKPQARSRTLIIYSSLRPPSDRDDDSLPAIMVCDPSSRPRSFADIVPSFPPAEIDHTSFLFLSTIQRYRYVRISTRLAV